MEPSQPTQNTSDISAYQPGITGPDTATSLQTRKPALEPAIVVIFGITGDLSKRKLLPALYHLLKDGLLHDQTIIVGVTRRDVTAEALLDDVELCVQEVDGTCDPDIVQKLHERLRMLKMDITEGSEYDRLLQELNTIEDTVGTCMNRLYYLSIPPQVYGPIVRLLGEHNLNKSCQHDNATTRLLVEKPFGYDLASAQELISETGRHFGEEQLYRIDHYLAKETVQNILAFRTENPIFENLWNAKSIKQIQISSSEQIGIEDRVIFYEQTGALRDLIQSHLLQLLALVTMDIPAQPTADAIHQAKLDILQAVVPPDPTLGEQVMVRGQYEDYRTEVDNPNSIIETYAAIRLDVNTPRWGGMPVIIRSGKNLKTKYTAVSMIFKPSQETTRQNILTFRIQPNEGISIDLRVKKPGFDDEIVPVEMDFSYQRHYEDSRHPDAYERVLVDAVRGDHTLFATSEEVLASWRIVEPVLHVWRLTAAYPSTYVKGSWGPEAAEALARQAGTPWVNPGDIATQTENGD